MSENLDDRALTIARLRARWTTKVTCAIAADQIEADRREIEQLRAERDALRARIDDAATVTMIGISPTAGYLGYTNPSGGFFESSFEDCPECPILGKRVALVPLDD